MEPIFHVMKLIHGQHKSSRLLSPKTKPEKAGKARALLYKNYVER